MKVFRWGFHILVGIVIIGVLYMLNASATAAERAKDVSSELQLVEGDAKGNEIRSLKTEMLVSSAEESATKQLKRLLRKYRNTPMEPGLWLRMAELNMRKAKTERFFEIHRESNTVVKLAPQRVKTASSERMIRKAIKNYEMIQRRFPRFKDMDLVLFNNAFARQQLGHNATAKILYTKLTSKYTESPLVPDAYLAVGEMNYQERKFALALAKFNKVKHYPESRAYPYGLYKAGWAKYNLSDAPGAIKEMEAVVAFGDKISKSNGGTKLNLRTEALRDMVLFYEETYSSEHAFAYFLKQAGREEVGPLILRLSALYSSHARYKDQEKVSLDFIDELPNSVERPRIHRDLVKSFETARNRPYVLKHLDELEKICHSKSRWYKANVRKPSKTPKDGKKIGVAKVDLMEDEKAPTVRCRKMLETNSANLAAKWQRLWKKNPTHPLFANSSQKAYEIYLRVKQPEDETKHKARFSYAELLFSLKKYRAASAQYAIVGAKAKTKKIKHDGGYAALVSLEKDVKDKWSDKDERLFQKLADVYVTRNPKGKYRTDILFKTAFIAYEKGRYDEAAPKLKSLGWTYPDTKRGLKAQNLFLDILNIKKDYVALKKHTKDLMKFKGQKGRKSSLQKIYEESYFAQIQTFEEKKKLEKASKDYRKFAIENPKSPLAYKAWWNSFELQFQVGDFYTGAKWAHEYFERFAGSPKSVEALKRSAQVFESMGELTKALSVLSDLIKVDKGNRTKWRMLRADYLALLGAHKQAREAYRNLMSSKKAKTVKAALGKLELLEKEVGTPASHIKILKEVVRWGYEPQATIARWQLAEKLMVEERYPEAFKMSKKVLKSKSKKVPRIVKASARMIQARILQVEFEKQSVKARAARLSAVLRLKTGKLDKAQRAFASVMRYGDSALSVDALRRMASCYAHYAKALRTMPKPKGFTDKDAEAFKNEIEKLTLPMEDKSVEAMAQALDNAKKYEVHNGVIPEIQKEIDRLNMKRVAASKSVIQEAEIAVPYSRKVEVPQ